jgi:cell wall-associated NlpC family hydrolase
VRRVLFAALALSLAAACAPRVRPTVAPPAEPPVAPPAERVIAPPVEPADPGQTVASAALALVGAPYLGGGTSPAGFDCSGFVRYVFGEIGIAMPRAVREQASMGERIDRGHLRPGDLVFFAIDGRTVSHVGIAVGPDSFVHAPSSHGRVREESLGVAYWDKRFAEARRVLGQ